MLQVYERIHSISETRNRISERQARGAPVMCASVLKEHFYNKMAGIQRYIACFRRPPQSPPYVPAFSTWSYPLWYKFQNHLMPFRYWTFSPSSVNACMSPFTFSRFQIAVLSPAPVSRITPPQAPEMMGREKCRILGVEERDFRGVLDGGKQATFGPLATSHLKPSHTTNHVPSRVGAGFGSKTLTFSILRTDSDTDIISLVHKTASHDQL